MGVVIVSTETGYIEGWSRWPMEVGESKKVLPGYEHPAEPDLYIWDGHESLRLMTDAEKEQWQQSRNNENHQEVLTILSSKDPMCLWIRFLTELLIMTRHQLDQLHPLALEITTMQQAKEAIKQKGAET